MKNFYLVLFLVFILGLCLVNFTTSRVQAQSSPVGYAIVTYGKIFISLDSGTSWTRKPISHDGDLASITSSSDGQKLAVVAHEGYIYTSSDGGTTWTPRTSGILGGGRRNWRDITSSANGQNLAAVEVGYIYTSDDGGATWTPRTLAGSDDWHSITSSDNGQYLAAAPHGYIYTSDDYGVNWTPRTSGILGGGSRDWRDITSSANGQRLAAVEMGYIYTSDNYGVNWTPRATSIGSRSWRSITSSDNGQYLAAVEGDYIYTSDDYGVNWTRRDSTGEHYWNGITSSGNGQKILALATDPDLTRPPGSPDWTVFTPYTSSDYGVNWDEGVSLDSVGGRASLEISITSFSLTPVPPPADPYNLIVSKTCSTNVTLKWKAISGATSYTITRQTGSVLSSFDATGATYNPTTQTWTYYDVAAAANTLYTYTVKANNAVPSNPPRAISTSPDLCYPILTVTTFCGLQEELQPASAIFSSWFLAIFKGALSSYNKLSWIAPMDTTGLQGYNIYRDGAAPGNKIITTGLVDAYNDTSANVTNSSHSYMVKSVYQTMGEVGSSNTAVSTICPGGLGENPPVPGLTKQVQLWFDPIHSRPKPATDNDMDNQLPLIITREGQNVKVDYSWTPNTLSCRGAIESAPSDWTITANAQDWLGQKSLAIGSFSFTNLKKGTYIVKLNCTVPPVAKNNSSWLANIWHTITGITQSSSVNSNPITITVIKFTFEEF